MDLLTKNAVSVYLFGVYFVYGRTSVPLFEAIANVEQGFDLVRDIVDR